MVGRMQTWIHSAMTVFGNQADLNVFSLTRWPREQVLVMFGSCSLGGGGVATDKVVQCLQACEKVTLQFRGPYNPQATSLLQSAA